MRKIYLIIIAIIGVVGAKAQVIDEHSSIYKGSYGTLRNNDTIPQLVKLMPTKVALNTNRDVQKIKRSNPANVIVPNTPNSYAINRSGIVGEIKIDASTTPSGGQSYAIPISVVPSRKDTPLRLSVTYNSQGSNGVLGKGWNLGGLSAITRGNYSIYYDGKTEGAKNRFNDAFYIDGVRLIKLSQTATKIVYQSERGNIRVTAKIRSSRINYFLVDYPNGSKATYGYNSTTSNTMVYPITQYQGTNNNIIDYTYFRDNNQYRIQQIAYGKNKNFGSNYATVNFSYVERSDKNFGWHIGQKTTLKHLLNKIICKNGNQPIYTYAFTYVGNHQKLLSQVDCNVNGSNLNPLRFFYGNGEQTPQLIKRNTKLFSYFSSTSANNLVVKKGKFDVWSDDDGLIVYPNKNPYVLNNHKYVNLTHHEQNILVYHGLSDNYTFPQKAKAEYGFITMLSADVDGKSGEEVIKINLNVVGNKDQIKFKMYKPVASAGGLGIWREKTINTSTTLNWNGKKSVHPKYFFTGDYDGDGRMDIFAVSRNKPLGKNISSHCYLFDPYNGTTKFDAHVFNYNTQDIATDPESDILIPIDYNADGKTDIALINETGLHIFTFIKNGSTFSMQNVGSNLGITKNSIKHKKMLLSDINGDGKVDFLISPEKSYYSNRYIQMPVNAPHTCSRCGGVDPVEGAHGYAMRYMCRHCHNKTSTSF